MLDVGQGSDYASVIFSKVAGLQPATSIKRWTASQVYFKDFGNLARTPLDGCFKRNMLLKVLLKFMNISSVG